MAVSRKWIVTAGTAVLVVGLGAWALRGGGDVQYRTVPVERGDIAYNISASGNLSAVVTVQVGSQVSGNISALYADFNTRVTKGQVVARIDPQIFQARVDQASANLNAARASVASAIASLRKSEAAVAGATASVADARANVMKAESAAQLAKQNLDRRVALANQGILSREDRENAQSASDTAVAGVQAAQAQLQAAEQNVSASKAQVDVSRTAVNSAEAQVKQATAALAQAQADLENTFIRAPVDGVVVARRVDVGQTVAASLQAPTLFEIAQDLTKMEVDTNVSEADIGRVQVGQQAVFTVDAYPGVTFRGRVDSIRKAPVNLQNVITYVVVVTADNPDLKLFPGMTANVNILVDRREDVLKVPNAALRFRPADQAADRKKSGAQRKGGAARQVVWVLDDPKSGKPRPVPVETGLSDGTNTEVSGDLQPGQRVVIAAASGDEKRSPAGPTGGARRGPRGPGF